MEFSNLIETFSDTHGLKIKKPEKDGSYVLTVDGSWVVRFFQLKQKLYLEGEIGELPNSEENKYELLKKILQINLGLIHDNRIVLCLHPEKELLMAYVVNSMAEVTVNSLEGIFSELVYFIEYFSEIISSYDDKEVPIFNPHVIMP